jgi:hypothetical protein
VEYSLDRPIECSIQDRLIEDAAAQEENAVIPWDVLLVAGRKIVHDHHFHR